MRYEPSDGAYLLTTGFDKLARLWSAVTFQRLLTLTGHENRISGGDISPDGSNRIVTVAHDKTIKMWAADSDVEPMT